MKDVVIGYPAQANASDLRVCFPAGDVTIDTARQDSRGREVVAIDIRSDNGGRGNPFVLVVDPRQHHDPALGATETNNDHQTVYLVRADHKHPIPGRPQHNPLWANWYGRAEDCPYCPKTLGEALIGSVVSILVEPFRDLPAIVMEPIEVNGKPSVLVNFTTVTAHRLPIPADTAIEVLEAPAALTSNLIWTL